MIRFFHRCETDEEISSGSRRAATPDVTVRRGGRGKDRRRDREKEKMPSTDERHDEHRREHGEENARVQTKSRVPALSTPIPGPGA